MEQDDRPRVEVCFSPNLYPLHKEDHEIVVVIDVLRATSAICAAFNNGVEGIIPVASIEEARELQEKGYLAGAERNGQIVDGFEFGNSPLGFKNDRFKGKTVVLTTTNGTKTIHVARNAPMVVIGALTNLDVLVSWLHSQKKSTLCLCAGWKDKFNLEDTICAGAIADALIDTSEWRSEEDSSIAAKYMFQSARDNYFGYLKSSSHRRRLSHLNIREDIKYCLTPNLDPVIPTLQDGVLRKLEV